MTGGAWGKVDNPSGGSSDFVITATLSNDKWALDKTFDQIQEANSNGLKLIVKMVDSSGTSFLPLMSIGTYAAIFGAAVSTTTSVNAVTLMVTRADVDFTSANATANNPNGTMPQVKMAAAPTEAMQIATKKYVDDKEFILQSTTPNSTKKFKITVDDTGALSAVEVTT